MPDDLSEPILSARPAETSDRDDEQHYLNRAHELLADMTFRAEAAADDAARRAPSDWNATVAHRYLRRRVASMAADKRPLCFGRIDEDGGGPWYIGRRHVEDHAGEPVVVDWRAPVAVPFYRATFRDPLGLRRRRRFILERERIVDLLDEDFDDPDSAGHSFGAGLPDPLLAELGRAREGTMHDIVATIAAEQDRIIRAPLDTPLVVQGGPGTGKTAVGLHRAAFLLYEHRAALERQGVLVLGPNRLFLAYIAQVLPSLGEVAVVQTTLSGLAGTWSVRGEDRPELGRLKGDPRLVDVVARACRAGIRPPDVALEASTRWGTVNLAVGDVSALLEAARASGGTVSHQRLRFRRAVARAATSVLSQRRLDMVMDHDEISADLRRDRKLQAALNRLWPAQSAPALIRSMLGRESFLAEAAAGVLTAEELRMLYRPPGRSVSSERWTEADLPLLDEAHSQLAEPPRRYGHIVVDEAQDLSAMALRMVARRSLDGRSFTILGDLAQATAPGATLDWEATVAALGDPVGAQVEELRVGYRVPRQIMDLANRLIARSAPGLPTTISVRVGDEDPTFRVATEPSLVQDAVDECAKLLPSYSSLALIANADRVPTLVAALVDNDVAMTPLGQPAAVDQVTVLTASQAKGLEFDAVVVVEPADFLADRTGVSLLYIAITRAVQHLSIVHTGALALGGESDHELGWTADDVA